MKSTLAVGVALVLLLLTAPSFAQSLTPIRGWVPFDSPKAKALMQDDPTISRHLVAHKLLRAAR